MKIHPNPICAAARIILIACLFHTPAQAAADKLEGVLLTPDGKPADNAQIAMLPEKGDAPLGIESDRFVRKDGTSVPLSSEDVYHTDAAGRFSLPAVDAKKEIFFLR